jgi:uncharacterized protein HemX
MNPDQPPQEYPPQGPQPVQPQPVSSADPYASAQPINSPQYSQSTSYEQDPYLTQQPAPVQSPNIFVSQPTQKTKKPTALIIGAIAVVFVLLLAGLGFYGWQAGWFGGQQAQQQVPAAPVAAEEAFDTAAAIETEITDAQEALDSIDDSQLADDTISDTTLGQ